PHFPLHAPSEDIDRYRETYQAGWDAIRQARWERVQELGIVEGSLSEVERDVGLLYDFPKAWEPLGEAELKRPIPWEELTDEQRAFQAVTMAIHAAMVVPMDRNIGRVIDQLKAMNAFEHTLILFL